MGTDRNAPVAAASVDGGDLQSGDRFPAVVVDWPVDPEWVVAIAVARWDLAAAAGPADEPMGRYTYISNESLFQGTLAFAEMERLAGLHPDEFMSVLTGSRTIAMDRVATRLTGHNVRADPEWRFEYGADQLPQLWAKWWRANRTRFVQ